MVEKIFFVFSNKNMFLADLCPHGPHRPQVSISYFYMVIRERVGEKSCGKIRKESGLD